ncbi:MAG: ribonuclease J [Clostridia bacterium]|nr:ribonuclease J [Clostridia bacterium]MBR3715033.1 ribonuclease J [Clostridia bacterium]
MAKKAAKKLKVACLGGLGEIGKNLTVLEYGDDMIIIDCGMGFPDDDMLGVDLVIPDFSYLKKNADRIRGVFLTHGHEDHIGSIPYLLSEIDVPIYGTRLTIGIIKYKLEEHKIPFKPRLFCVEAGDVIEAGEMFVEFIHVNHSIADACALAIFTPLGTVIHTGDFKLDLTPIDGEVMDLTRFGELGKEGVLLLMCESTNAERPGFTPSEKTVGESLKSIFMRHPKKRIVITTFSSNVHRVQQIIDISVAHKRKVAVIGRSMQNIVSAAIELGYMHVPEGAIIDIGDIKNYNPENVTVITTGSQGEPMSALYRMAFSDHAKLNLGNDDLVVISANPIPGNEKLVDRLINEFTKNNVTVFRDSSVEIHVSGHACQGELKLLQALVKPKYFMPVHGEHKHLAANRDLAKSMGQDASTIFIGENGKVLEISSKSAKFNGTVPGGVLFVDGSGVGDVGNIVLRDRKHLSEEGIIVVVASVSLDEGLLMSGPEIITRGFVYMRESEELIAELRRIAYESIYDGLDSDYIDWAQLKNMIKDDLARYIYSKTKRRPMILPIILDV